MDRKNFQKNLTVLKIVAQCRQRVIPYLYPLKRSIAYALPNAIAYLDTCIPYLNTCIAYLNTCIPYLNTCIAYLNTCIPYLNTLTRLSAPYLITCIPFLSKLTRLSAPYLNTLNRHDSSRQPIRIELPSLQPITIENHRQPIRIGYYVTRVVSQWESSITSPESSITSPESSRLGWRTLLRSRLESARYSLSWYMRVLHPPPSQLTLLLLFSFFFQKHVFYETLLIC